MLTFTAELFLHGAILSLVAAVILLLLRRSAAASRHVVCVTGLAMLLLLPAGLRVIPPVAILPEVRSGEQSPSFAAPIQRRHVSKVPDSPETQQTGAPQSLPLASAAPSTPQVARNYIPERSSRISLFALGSLWAIVTFVLLIRLFVASSRLQRIRTEAHPSMCGDRKIYLSDTAKTPLTWGIRNPIIVLPSLLIGAECGASQSAVLHELAHIQRRDWVWNLFAEVACALCWFQPGMWWLRRQMRLEAELACDDAVLLSGVAGPDYAEHLVAILRTAHCAGAAPAMALHGSLSSRMNHILSQNTRRTIGRKRLCALGVCSAILFCCVAVRLTAKAANLESNWHAGTQTLEARASNMEPPLPGGSGPESIDFRRQERGVLASISSGQPRGLRGAPPSQAVVSESTFERTAGDTTNLVDGLKVEMVVDKSCKQTALNRTVNYQVLVHNISKNAQAFELQCWNADGLDIPYFVPESRLSAAFASAQSMASYRATSWPSSALGLIPAYLVHLEPGESIVVPGNFGITLGASEHVKFPEFKQAALGKNWIIQPLYILKIQQSDYKNGGESSPISVTILNASGKRLSRKAYCVASASAGKRVYARESVEVIGDHAPSDPASADVRWGTPDKGLQCGLRMLTVGNRLKPGDILRAEVLWRNVSKREIYSPRPSKLDLQALIREKSGRYLSVDWGPRPMLLPTWRPIKPGETVSLGNVEVCLSPRKTEVPADSEQVGHILLTPGTYWLMAMGGVSAKDGGSPLSGTFEFTLVGDNDTLTRASTISWGAAQNGICLGLKVPGNQSRVPSFKHMQFEVYLCNRSAHAQQVQWLQPGRLEMLSPDLFTSTGEPLRFEHLIAGPYMEQSAQLQAGQTVMIGKIALPDRAAELFDALPRGPYTSGKETHAVGMRAQFKWDFRSGERNPLHLVSQVPFELVR